MATDICFVPLSPSIWKMIWSLYNMWQNNIKWQEKFFIIDSKRFFQYLNFCNKTNKFSGIDTFNHRLLATKIFCTSTFWLSYVEYKYSPNGRIRNNLNIYFSFPSTMSSYTSITANKILCLQINSLIRPWRILRDRKKAKWHSFLLHFVHYGRLSYPCIYFRLPDLWQHKAQIHFY